MPDAADLAALLETYAAGPALLAASVEGLAGGELLARPIPGKWSALEVVCHVSDCEQFLADRMKRTLSMDKPLLLGTRGARYAEALSYHGRDLGEELDLVRLTRSQLARILRALPPEAFERPAVHSESGLVTLERIVRQAANHLQNHARTIDEKRAALGGTGTM